MATTRKLAAVAAALSLCSSAMAAFQGFNYGSTFTTGAAKMQSDFEAEFKTAQGLVGTNGGFTSARLYTTIQAGTANAPISAIPAAMSTKTTLLLGIWCSAGQAVVDNEIQALKSAIDTHGTALAPFIAGISVGSEDLYRKSPTGVSNGENPGAEADVIASYIKQVRDALAGGPLAGVPIGHVDTWTAWVDGANKAVVDACDWIGVDAYPYFQSTMDNSIENSKALFNSAVDQTRAHVGGKPIWITETGFPVSGKTSNKAIPSPDNAKTYWQQVGCPMFGVTNVWWFTLEDAAPATPNPSFGIIGSTLSTSPIYDLSCENVNTGPDTPTNVPSASTPLGTTIPTLAGGSPGASNTVSVGPVPTSSHTPAVLPDGSNNGTRTTSSGSPTKSTDGSSPNTNAASYEKSGPLGAAFAAVMIAALVL